MIISDTFSRKVAGKAMRQSLVQLTSGVLNLNEAP